MKKLIFTLLVLVATLAASAQTNITAKMAGVPFGKVKSCLEKPSREAYTFDRDGNTLTYSVGKDSIIYTRQGDEVTGEIHKKGKVKDSFKIKVIQESPEKIVLELEDTTIEENYRPDGNLITSVISAKDQKLIQEMQYKDAESAVPVKMIMGNGLQSAEAKVSNVKFDEKGNWISMIVNAGDETDKITRVIEYYED
jgi:hypothetical protein